jgi:hypothetical protein
MTTPTTPDTSRNRAFRRRAAIAVRRSLAHDAGFRRRSRWRAAGAPLNPPAGRTPYVAGAAPRAAGRPPLDRYPWDLPETAAQKERIAEQHGGGEARARELFRGIPRVTVLAYHPAPGARAERKAARAARKAARS